MNSNLPQMNSQERKAYLTKQGLNNPTQEILFFKHNKKPMGYVLMSDYMNEEIFYQNFPKTNRCTEAELDKALEDNPDYKVVFVGDDYIIDDHFTNQC